MEHFKSKKIVILILAGAVAPIVLSLLITKFGPIWQKLKPSNGPQEVKIVLPKGDSKSASLQNGPFKCPSTADFCQKGQDFFQNGTYIGWAGRIPKGSPITASFDGKLSSTATTLPPEFNNEEITIVYLDNTDRGLRAIYYFKGKPPKQKEIKEGEDIGGIDEPMAFYDGYSLIYSIIKDYPQNREKATLGPKDFK